MHRYSSAGKYVATISGEEGDAGAFDCPHAIFIDTRKGVPELYVADRGNGRVQVYDAEGMWLRVFGDDFLTSPSGFVVYGELLVIAELNARITICGADDRPVTYLGDNGAVADMADWPNNHNERGESVRTALLEPGKFNSPHGMAVDAQGNLYVAEWLIGGRSIKLAKVQGALNTPDAEDWASTASEVGSALGPGPAGSTPRPRPFASAQGDMEFRGGVPPPDSSGSILAKIKKEGGITTVLPPSLRLGQVRSTRRALPIAGWPASAEGGRCPGQKTPKG